MDSTQSESAIVPGTPDAKKKTSIMGKLKQLTRSRQNSIEESGIADFIVNAGIKVSLMITDSYYQAMSLPGRCWPTDFHCCSSKAIVPGVNPRSRDLSVERDSENKKDKKTVKDKITGIFKKSAPSRSNRLVSNASPYPLFLLK